MASCNLRNFGPCLSQFREIQLFPGNLMDFINYNKPLLIRMWYSVIALSEACLEPCLTSKMKRFTKRVGGYYRLKLAIQSLQRILKRRANFVKIGILKLEYSIFWLSRWLRCIQSLTGTCSFSFTRHLLFTCSFYIFM